MSQMKKTLLTRLIISVIISLALGLLCILINGEKLLQIIFIIIGAFLLIDGIIGLVNNYKSSSSNLLILNSISIVLGILLMFNINVVVNIIIALYFIALPLFEIIKNKDNYKNEIKNQLPKFIIAILIILFGIGGLFNILLKIIGWGLIIFAIVYLILGLVSLSKHE